MQRPDLCRHCLGCQAGNREILQRERMISLKDRVTEILIHNKLITQEQLEQALQAQRQKGGRLSDIIVAFKFVKEHELISALSEGLGLPLIDLKRFKIDLEIVKLIP